MNVQVLKVSADQQLQEIFRQAQAEKTPVSLYRRPVPGRICLDFSDWKEIEVFDVENLMVVVPPGILLKDLNAAAAAQGLRFIPGDTPFLENLSVGEWAYRGCPNPSTWKYGAGKHFLLGSTYVLPNGDITPVGGKCIKNVSGYDFTRFFTGGYADLAVGVRYIIKLLPQPAYRHRFDVAVASPKDAVELVGRLQARSVPPAWLFWLDEETGGRLLGQRQPGHRVLFELDGNKAEVLDHVAAINNILAEGKILSAETPAAIPDLSSLESAAGGFWLLTKSNFPIPRCPPSPTASGRYLRSMAWGAASAANWPMARLVFTSTGNTRRPSRQLFAPCRPRPRPAAAPPPANTPAFTAARPTARWSILRPPSDGFSTPR
ncbi:MAG TPA: FAD-binding oxidoreductase [Negativicutes bacterium]|nr:FAD-binding oxidoreductase [Negativicutes bacterium]